ncbi:hypothetical protein TSUD_136100 [Trifolium subterraneum]|uniref:Aminotransferase-like plant mobile domain-containing protein n=1 Tax=Trifolium subterraneum TaxID=3900 RepID=A0A2Z6P1N2_TRISU|nr:hypothetical protein TSUD_136100 [Trifolium subterraneum]
MLLIRINLVVVLLIAVKLGLIWLEMEETGPSRPRGKGAIASVRRTKQKEHEKAGGRQIYRHVARQQPDATPEEGRPQKKLEGPSWTDCIFEEEEPTEFLGGPKDKSVLALLSMTRLAHLAKTDYQHLDPCLISAFVERWHEETSSFHMIAWMITVTLDDVFYLLHLPLGGRLLDHVPISKADSIDLMVRLLGSEPFDVDTEGPAADKRDSPRPCEYEALIEEKAKTEGPLATNLTGFPASGSACKAVRYLSSGRVVDGR